MNCNKRCFLPVVLRKTVIQHRRGSHKLHVHLMLQLFDFPLFFEITGHQENDKPA